MCRLPRARQCSNCERKQEKWNRGHQNESRNYAIIPADVTPIPIGRGPVAGEFELACVSISPQTAATAAAISAPAPLADVVGDTRLLDQPSNAARLDALQGLLKKRGLAFSLQPFANSARQRDGREQGQNVLLEPFGGDGPLIILGAGRPSRWRVRPAILRAIHSPEDTADKLSAEGPAR